MEYTYSMFSIISTVLLNVLFGLFCIKRIVRSQFLEIVLFGFITVIYFLLNILFQIIEGLNSLTYHTYNRELRVA